MCELARNSKWQYPHEEFGTPSDFNCARAPLSMADYAHLSVKQRVEQMIADAQQQFACRLSINQSNRSAEQAQQFHVCHMFLHNFFKHLKPKHLSTDGRTIDWIHLSDAAVNWDLISQPEKYSYIRKIIHQLGSNL
jgi:hypothetical protein